MPKYPPLDLATFTQNTLDDGHSQRPVDMESFVPVPVTQELDYVVISDEAAKESGMRPIGVRLLNGRQWGNREYGVAHMLVKHGSGLALAGYFSVQDYVIEVVDNFDAIYKCRDGRWKLVARKDQDFARDRSILVELKGTYYSVVSGWPQTVGRPIKDKLVAERIEKDGKLIWERRA